ncbi:hypothetical protein GCM10007422_08660 [Pedobacter zeae]|nr:hypothetical protein GCM10007422_08660 [Pedobacter zeae]
MSVPFFENYGWIPEVVSVNPDFADCVKDPLLLKSIPKDIPVHIVKALPKNLTSKFGLGSIALRSLYYYRKKVNQLLKDKHFDLIYFSTTQFPILILGAYWRKKYGVPYVIDMQDPWHSEYYQAKPKNERPPKYWFSYRLNKFLEPIAMNSVSGLISVSQSYLDTLVLRYPHLISIPKKVITFGFFKADFDLIKENSDLFNITHHQEQGTYNFTYIGRGGIDMVDSLKLLFTAFKKGLTENADIFNKIRFNFIGTSYASKGKGIQSIMPIADEIGISRYVHEQTDRIAFYKSIDRLLKSDHLLIIGSNDAQYTASKIFPYILANKPLLALFNPKSSAGQIIKNCNAGTVFSLESEQNTLIKQIYEYLFSAVTGQLKKLETDWLIFEAYSAENLTKSQVKLFNQIIAK